MSFSISIVDYPAKLVAGLRIRTEMQKAKTECPALWHTLVPRMSEISAWQTVPKGIYGVSLMVNESEFDYWAALETSGEDTVPQGMETFSIPAGRYAKCPVASMEQLFEAYMYVYGTWASEQAEYTVNEMAPCFELYSSNWQENDSFEIYVPLKKK